jgi:hypothetical protein
VRKRLNLPAAGGDNRLPSSSPINHNHVERSKCHIETNGRSTMADTVLLRRRLLLAGLGDERWLRHSPGALHGGDEFSDWGKAMGETEGEGGSGTFAGSTGMFESMLVVVKFLRRGPCRKARALLRPRNDDDGCDARLVRISGSDLDGDLGDIDEESVFSSWMLQWRFGNGLGGAERIVAAEVGAKASN